MTKLTLQYDPQAYEPSVYQQWESQGVFEPDQQALKAHQRPFVIMLPLPNVTGNLHMGHALQHTLSDVLIRYHRMKGEPTLWQPGTDHAGIATQNAVEKELRQEGLTRHDLGRAKFLKRVWDWKEKYGDQIVAQMKRLGASCDWSRFQFTMDPPYVEAVQEAFIRYYHRGYIYRGNRIVNWCPRCASVVSDLEVKHEERQTQLTTIRYPLAAADGIVEVATTRPETMLGDTAVAVHPQDDRYKTLVGKTVRLPLVGRKIPVIADDRVDKDFGTGAIKVTPAHDPLDAAIAQTHKLPAINVIGEDGRMTKLAGRFAGLPVGQARDQVIEALQQEGVLVGQVSYRHNVALCERCGTVIEPLISRQWFVDMSKLKDETIAVVEKDLVRFYGPRWKKHFLGWMSSVHDWTISRQLWWGQPVPVWWKKGRRGTEHEEGNYIVSVEAPTQAGEWEQDPDVLDTWFSSAIWPLATLGWPSHTEDLKTFYPTSVLATAREILYLWVARMIFSGLDLLKGDQYGNRTQPERIPFHNVLIHPTVLTKDGKRMSKSLGTGVDPLDLIKEYGADATRFGLLYQTSYDSQALKFDKDVIVAARNFTNKIWNLARLLDSLPERDGKKTLADQWIEQASQQVASNVSRLLETYRIGEAARLLYEFVWRDFADWYVEIVKVEGSVQTAQQVFDTALRLLHPFVPHVSEVLWQHRGQGTLLAVSDWPTSAKTVTPDAAVLAKMAAWQDIVRTVRGVRTLLAIKPGSTALIYLEQAPPLQPALAAMTRATIAAAPKDDMRPFPLQGGASVLIGSEDITEESIARARRKLTQEQEKLENFMAGQRQALEQMRGKAEDEKISEKEAKVDNASQRLQEIKQSLKALS
jgi:valyl-tRNA synthetase